MKKSTMILIGILCFFIMTAASIQAKDKDVIVNNTESNPVPVAIVGSEDVIVSNTESNPVPVEIVGSEEVVTIRLSGEFVSGSAGCCLKDPGTGAIPGFNVSQFLGKRLIMEYVSCQALMYPDQPVFNLYLGDSGQNAPVDMVVPIELTGPYWHAMASDGWSGWAYHANHQVKVILDKTSRLLLNGRQNIFSPSGGANGRVSCIVTGRLVD